MTTAPLLTIITVCYHAREDLRRTLENVCSQTWSDFEYWIIDGASADGTVELLKEQEPLFLKKGISFHYVSEPDHGIYDAMNKGARMAQGDYLLFLNAGDLLASPDLLGNIFASGQTADVLYGDALCTYQGRQRLYPALPLERLVYEMAFCHQAAFVRRELMLSHPYDLSYKVCADHEFFLFAWLQKKTFSYLSCPVCIYEIAGYSDKNIMRAHKEQQRMQKELGVFRPSMRWLKNEVIFYFKQGLKALFGQRLIDLVRRMHLR